MNVLDSPLEALAFNLVNLGPLLSAVFNNLWAWVAIITATAFSLWSLRPYTVFKPLPPTDPETTPSPPPSTSILTNTKTMPCKGSDKKEEEEEGVLTLTRGESFKKRFTAYYEEEENEDNEDEVDCGDDEVSVVKRWGLTVEVPGNDLYCNTRAGLDLGLGWYGYQDRRVIDGSVVRLREDDRQNGSTLVLPLGVVEGEV